jgi:hypothetical protein
MDIGRWRRAPFKAMRVPVAANLHNALRMMELRYTTACPSIQILPRLEAVVARCMNLLQPGRAVNRRMMMGS